MTCRDPNAILIGWKYHYFGSGEANGTCKTQKDSKDPKTAQGLLKEGSGKVQEKFKKRSRKAQGRLKKGSRKVQEKSQVKL